MKVNDIVQQLRLLLPKYSTLLSNIIPFNSVINVVGTVTITTTNNHGLVTGDPVTLSNMLFHNILGTFDYPVSSLTRSGTTVTVVTTGIHGIITGQQVTIAGADQTDYNGAFTATVVDVNTFTYQIGTAPVTPATGTITASITVIQSGTNFTFATVSPHDLTLNYQENVTLVGFADSTWNSQFDLINVPNRNTFTVRSTNSLPTIMGSEYLSELRADGANGRFQVTVIGSTIFTITGPALNGTYSQGSINSEVRVAGSVTIERAIDLYTKRNMTDLWAFVVPNDVEVSKDRNTLSDATLTIGGPDDMRLRLIDGFTVTFVKSTVAEIAAVDAIDICRHTLIGPLLKSLYGATFPTGLSGCDDFKVIFTGAGLSGYNKAMISYTYNFELPMDLTINDAVSDLDNRAFRDIDFTETVGGSDTDDMTVVPIDLDADS